MIGTRTGLGLLRPRLLAALVVCLVPAVALAQDLVFRNECPYAVTVQAVAVRDGKLWRKAHTLRPLDSTPKVRLPGNKIITVYDPRVPNRVLLQAPLREGTTDLYFSIVQDRVTRKVGMIRRPAPPARGGGMRRP
jgi:hypothetical protein